MLDMWSAESVAWEDLFTADGFTAFLAAFAVFFAIAGAIGLLLFLWYLWAMARLFPRIGLPAGHGWIPLWNEWRLIERTGLPGWTVLLYLVPGLGIVPVIFRTLAQHRIGREAGVGGGYTVLGFFIPALWATLMGSRLQGRVLGEQRPAVWPGQAAAPFAATPGFVNPSAPAPPPQQTAPIAPDPWASPAWSSASRSASSSAAATGASGAPMPAAAASSPFGSETEAEYARLAAEPFQAPPAAPLGQAADPEPFSWTAASRSEPPAPPSELPPPPVHPAAAVSPAPVPAAAAPAPAPAPPPPAMPAPGAPNPAPSRAAAPASPVAAQHRSSGITANYDPLPAAAPVPAPAASAPDDDLDRTVVVHRQAAVRWTMVLPSGEELELGPDTIVGRRPVAESGARALEIPDPTRTLSKTHARLRFDGEQWTVEDLGSTNGVFIFDEGGAEHEAEPRRETPAGRHLMLGTLEIRLRRSDESI